MEHILTCTTEELALLVTLCGYPQVAKGIAEASLGERSEREWHAIMEATVHQLMVKEYWDYEKDARDEVPLSDSMQQWIHRYVQSQHLVRCSHARQHVLLLHVMDEHSPWVAHVVERDILHQFSVIPRLEVPKLVHDFYSFSCDKRTSWEPRQFAVSDEAFDLLSVAGNTDRVRRMSDFDMAEEWAFKTFTNDLHKQNWTLFNISYFYIPNEEEEPMLRNIVFFVPSTSGVWVVEYREEGDRPVNISLFSGDQWNELLQNVAGAIV